MKGAIILSVNDLLENEAFLPGLFVFLLSVFIFAIPTGLAMSKQNNNNIYGDNESGEIIEERNVKLIAKRTLPHPANHTIMINMVVFELSNGDRLELVIKDSSIYGVMMEGDNGILTYQGKKFLKFERSC